jgi:hypothetical protein
MTDFLIEHGPVITVDKKRRVIKDDAVAVEKDKILERMLGRTS